MRRLIVLVALLGLSLFLFPSVFAQDKAEVDPKLVAKALSNPYIQGKVVGLDKETKTITVQVVVDSKKVLNPEMQKKYQVVYAQAAVAFKAKDQKKYQQLVEEAKGVLAAMYDVKETVAPVMFKGIENVQFRVEKLPDRLGDDGKAKPYTPDEIKKAKGNDPNLPGFMTKAEDLDVEKLVRIYFPADQKKGAPPAAEPPYPARVILILPPPAGTLPGLPAPVGTNPFIIGK